MLSPSDQESRSMDDQVRRKFAVTNPSKKRKINNSPADDHSYSESSIDAEFSDLGYTGFATPNNGGGGGGNSNEATPGINDDIINANDCVNDNDEDDEEFLANDEEDNKDDEYFSSFPPGYRFKPYDEELVVYYLRRKIFYEDLPANRIKEVELYKYNPDTLAAKYKPNGENEWFFFTPRDRKYPNGDRPNRAAGGGYWKATGADKTINFNGHKVGLKKALVFYRGKPPRGDKTEWIMHEYRAVDAPKRTRITAHDMKLDDWVLCRIYKKLDRNVKATPRLSDEPIDQVAQTTDNMGNFPIMTGLTGNFNYGDSSIVGCSYHNSNGLPTVPESLDLSIDQTSAYVQQMIFPPLMDSSTFSAPSSSRISFYHSVPLPYDYPDLSATDFDQLFSTMPSEKGSTSK